MRRLDQVGHENGVEARLEFACGAKLAMLLGLDSSHGTSAGANGEFFAASVIVLLARLLRTNTVTVTDAIHQSRSFTAAVDLEASFRDLLRALHSPAEAGRGALRPAAANLVDGAIGEPAFAYQKLACPDLAAGQADEESVPRFSIESMAQGEEEANDAVTLALHAPGWPAEDARRVLGYLRTLMQSAADDLEQCCGTLALMDTPGALVLYESLNATEAALSGITVQEAIAEQARIDPLACAIFFRDISLTYREMEDQSSHIADYLRAAGAGQQHPVVIAMPRQHQVPMVMLAVLKAGSFFVPLDPAHPRQRLQSIVEECEPAVVVVTRATAHLFDGQTGLLVLDAWMEAGIDAGIVARNDAGMKAEAEPAARETRASGWGGVPSLPEDCAYMIYTSGTTGRPKGVMVKQRSLINLISTAQREPGLRRGDRMLAVATFAFDISIMDVFLPLSSGGAVVIASETEARDPAQIALLLARWEITCMQATPTTWRMLAAHGWTAPRGLRMLAGGEALPRDLANTLIEADGAVLGELWNSYGPTETTIYSAFLRIRAGAGPVPIGGPAQNTRFYVADAAGRLLPPGIAGELYIGGDGVALGYFRRPELNREKFIADPWTPRRGERLFRTGDEVRLLDDGTIEYFGRLDSQVKLRGYRIELGEIEAVLRAHAGVRDAAVVLREDEPGEPWLVAYVATTGTERFDAAEMRAHAASRLPAYMLPSRLVVLSSLPVTGSGKIDKRALLALPAPVEAAEPATAGQPADAAEAQLLRIFRETLRSPALGLDDSFFEHGGYSLLAVRLFARIAAALGRELPITALFDAPTVRGLAAVLRGSKSLATLVPIRLSGERAPFFMVQSYLLYGLAGSMVPAAHPVHGLRGGESRHGRQSSLDDRVTLCVDAIDRVHPRGLVHLGGWCAAAPLTIEIARRLLSQGRKVGMIALFDAEVPGFVQRPATGNARAARWSATLKYHSGRLRRLGWKARLAYIAERLTQQALQCVEWVYMSHRSVIERLHRRMPFLPSRLFFNRWTQLQAGDGQAILPIDARVWLLRASDVVLVPGSDPALGWNAIARGGVEVIFVPGHHESMFHEPQFSSLRAVFAQAMQRAEGAGLLQAPDQAG